MCAVDDVAVLVQSSASARPHVARDAQPERRKRPLMLDASQRKNPDAIWQAMRHLYPDATVERPQNETGFHAGMESKHLRERSTTGWSNPEGMQPSAVCQQACSHSFVSARSWNEVQQMEVHKWKRIMFAGDTWAEKGSDSVTCSHDDYSTTYRYIPAFGCVHESLRNVKENEEEWGFAEAAGLFADTKQAMQKASATIASLPRSQTGLDLRDDMPHEINHFLSGQEQGRDFYAVAVSYKGKVATRYSSNHGVDRTTKLHGWSMAKSVLSLLLGARQDEGKMDIRSIMSASDAGQAEKQNRGMTIENAMNMRIGHTFHENHAGADIWAVRDAAGFAIHGTDDGNAVEDRGFHYSSAMANVNSRELRLTFPDGVDGLADYLAFPAKALFSRIGADSFTCEPDQVGTLIFSSFCYATAEDWLKIGLLVLNRGRNANGEQVVSESWMNMSTQVLDTGADDHYTHMWYRLDHLYGYSTPVIGARGAYGQSIVVVPELELVIVRLGMEDADFIQDNASGNGPVKDLLDSLWNA